VQAALPGQRGTGFDMFLHSLLVNCDELFPPGVRKGAVTLCLHLCSSIELFTPWSERRCRSLLV
jgi:hypothetical protein